MRVFVLVDNGSDEEFRMFIVFIFICMNVYVVVFYEYLGVGKERKK